MDRLTLELSLKPFAGLDRGALLRACGGIADAWRLLLERAGEVAVLLWVGTGDEVLTWSGDLDDALPWACSIGFCNTERPGVYDPHVVHYFRNRGRPYRVEPPALRYRDLRAIVAALRETLRVRLGKEPVLGIPIDPGPEFADSAWRYDEHPEVLLDDPPGVYRPMRFLRQDASLRADRRAYAAFPDGLPDGTTLATLCGRQLESFCRALGFDYVWLSNGLGYSHDPWGVRGELFDGARFHPERAAARRRAAAAFWRELRAGCAERAIEVRGTNFTAGMDLATDGCSHRDAVALGGLERPPPNPPWGSRALGLEVAAYLSRLASAPGKRLPMRYYLNDPWFDVQPWYDYYGREPFDLYVPLSCARLEPDGSVSAPGDLSLMTLDTSAGVLRREQAAEVLPHVLRALDERADAPGPLVWVYPFTEYESLLEHDPARLPHVFAQEWFLARAIAVGLPLNTVCASEAFLALAAGGGLPDAVYVAPAPLGDWPVAHALLAHARNGGRVLLYGALDHAPAALLEAVGAGLAEEPLEGDLEIESRLAADIFAAPPRAPLAASPSEAAVGFAGSPAEEATAVKTRRRPLRHPAHLNGGGLRVVPCAGDDGDHVRVTVTQGDARRLYATCRRAGATRGALAWVHGSVAFDVGGRTLEPAWPPAGQVAEPAEWMRALAGELGVSVRQRRPHAAVAAACVFIKRSRGGWIFTGHKPNTTVRVELATAHGAPVFSERETAIEDGRAIEGFEKSFHHEARAFVRMDDGIVGMKELPAPPGKRRHFCLIDLAGADVTIFAEPGAVRRGELTLAREIAGARLPHHPGPEEDAACVRGYTGNLYVSW